MLLVKNINMVEHERFQTELLLIFFLYLTQIHVPFNLETYNISLNPTAEELKARKPETYKPGLVIPQIISRISSQRDFSKQKSICIYIYIY